MKRILLTIAFLLVSATTYASSCKECHAGPIQDSIISEAEKYLNVREASPPNANRGPEIDAWHKYYGLPFGNPYCQMYGGIAYRDGMLAHDRKSPFPKIARVCLIAKWANNHPLEVKTYSTKQIAFGAAKIRKADMLSFSHGTISGKETFNWDGHAALAYTDWPLDKGPTIEGNTKPGPGGDQTGRVKGDTKNGLDGVYKRERSLGLKSNFPIKYFIRLNE